MRRAGTRGGNIFLEVVVGFALFVLISVPLVTSFQSGVQQTRVIRSHAAARYLAEWALNQSRAVIAAGGLEGLPRPVAPATLLLTEDLSADAGARFGDVVAPLQDLAVQRVTHFLPTAGTGRGLYEIVVTVRWREKTGGPQKELAVRGIEGEEI